MIDWWQGEQKRLEFETKHRDGKDFTIAAAAYELRKANELIEQGSCIIDGHRISVILQLHDPGFYELCIEYCIAAEILRPKFMIKVI